MPEHAASFYRGLKFYDAKKNWRKLKPFLNNKELIKILRHDFKIFVYGRWRAWFKKSQYPSDWETCEWNHAKGRKPAYQRYVKHGACHWLVNFNLALAKLVEPDRSWRIMTSELHSTVWDGDKMLFDFNALALGTKPKHAFIMADGRHLKVGKFLKVWFMPSLASGRKGRRGRK